MSVMISNLWVKIWIWDLQDTKWECWIQSHLLCTYASFSLIWSLVSYISSPDILLNFMGWSFHGVMCSGDNLVLALQLASDVGLLLSPLPSSPSSLSSLSLSMSELRILGKEHAFILFVVSSNESEGLRWR